MAKNPISQPALFDTQDYTEWLREWVSMPEFVQEDLSPWKSVFVHFACPEDMEAFSIRIGQKLTERTQSLWYPAAEIGTYADKRYIDES